MKWWRNNLGCCLEFFREKVYGTAITFYEDYDEESLTDDQKDMLHLKKWNRKSDRKILANKCICLLSRWPFFEAFKQFLYFIYKRQLMGPFDIPLERWISHFLYDVPFPSPVNYTQCGKV